MMKLYFTIIQTEKIVQDVNMNYINTFAFGKIYSVKIIKST